MPTLYIVIEGQRIQEVVSDDPDYFKGVKVAVVDYDRESTEGEEVTNLKQRNGEIEHAVVRALEVRRANIAEVPPSLIGAP
jgi:hypothetical protein